jgi:hypothetical protein
MAFIKKFYFIITCIFLLASCGLFGGDDKVDVTENSVLSGPPLSIPPEFDIDSQNTNQQQSMPTYGIETLDQGSNIGNFENEPVYESTQNENLFTDEIPYMTNIENTGEIQSFENFNPNIVRSNRQTNIITSPKIQRTYRQTVPSDGYTFDRILPKNQKTYAQKKKDNFIGFGTKNFEQIGTGDIGGLSKEEEFLLEDILNSSDTK